MYKFMEEEGKILMVEVINMDNVYKYGDIVRHAIYVAGMQSLCGKTPHNKEEKKQLTIRFAGRIEESCLFQYYLYTETTGKEYLISKEIFSY